LTRLLDPADELTILELRLSQDSLSIFEEPALSTSLAQALGLEAAASLIGFHIEADFAFMFFARDLDPDPWLALHKDLLELRTVHRLRYDQWQDGAAARPIRLGPLEVIPASWQKAHQTSPASSPEDEKSIDNSSKASSEPKTSSARPAKLEPVIIDPGLAFGFGGHPTTLACLEFLLRLYHPHLISHEPIPKTVLDLGSGTGVLALTAARLGAAKVLGVDHSHLAVDAARQNAIVNSLEGQTKMVRGLAQNYAKHPAELIMANMPMFVLKDLVPLGAFDNRRFAIVSGLLPEEGEVFLELLGKGRTLKILDRKRSDRWMSFLIDGSSI
jgi:ribosomal protein L11 methylase PrmA